MSLAFEGEADSFHPYVFRFPIQESAGSLLIYVAALAQKRLDSGFGTTEYPKGKEVPLPSHDSR